MDKKRICIVCVIMVFSIMTGYLFEKESKEEISMEPDVVSSISMNRDQYFTVVANRNRIEDKEEFAKLLVKMCRENSFHTIKFSTDRGYATEIHMQVYLCEEDIEDANVILVCATVSVASGGVGAPAAVSMVFATSAKTGATFALSSGVISTAGTAIVTGIETKNVEETLKAAALAGSESFKWGAIVGVVSGGVSETVSLAKSARSNPTPRESELKVLERTKGAEEQISYLDGVEVSSATKGATRPDVVVKNADGSIKAIEVKNYNLASSNSRSELYRELERQVTSRANNLPAGSTQEIVLDVRGRGFSKDVIDNVVANIQSRCAPVYKDIPVTVMSY